MSSIFDCGDEDQLLAGMRHARQAIRRGDLIVMPTDTVYGVAADAFSPAAVQRLLDAKGRGRDQPPPVLIGTKETLVALAEFVPEPVQRLVDVFWPGGLTIVLPAQPSLVWDLGETAGTVAVRMPQGRVALELLAETGPLAVSSANLTGQPSATSAEDAERMLGDSVAVYLADGAAGQGVASTIVDATSLVSRGSETVAGGIRILREGAIGRERLAEVLGDLLEPEFEERPTDADEDS
ncbi:L-threonylcarbamoyladenylate synthase [Microbacterium sp. H83]|uniref:L-threonylcarbamoyladenylate synthase n=1 Tax=Microbacterium sp. H83 TaxID=1827324 RepID=UPI0007F370AD|nr:L-threonylcarbamoyladenylate synthase [Microbacterium sp. H83]OAN43500.1 threonylcarbamoyl-AMP synthase [Microbacterium sp. H83]